MNNDNLVRMVNQIGVFFDSMPDRNEGMEGIVTHLKKFWDPSMRKALLATIDAKQNSDLSEIVLDAIQKHRDILA